MFVRKINVPFNKYLINDTYIKYIVIKLLWLTLLKDLVGMQGEQID